MRRHWQPTPPVTPEPAGSAYRKDHEPPLQLRCDDYFERRRSCLGSVMAIRSRKVAWTSTLLNLYLLLNAVRALHSFAPLGVDDYAITSLASRDACLQSLARPPAAPAPDASANSTDASAPRSILGFALGKLESGLATLKHDISDATEAARAPHEDLATIMRTCRAQLEHSEAAGLREAKAAYWWAAHCFIVVAVALDVLRWCGCCTAVVDALLGFRSARLEQLRLLPQTLMLIPFAHLSFLLSRPIEMECCIGSPKPPMVYDRVRVLAWLSIIVSYCLFSDAHNHGFFLLRSVDRSAAALLRPRLGPEHQRHAADAAVLALAARLDST